MIKKYVKGSTYVFIDAANIYHSQKELEWRIDFLKLKRYFQDHTTLKNIYYYTAYDPEYVKQHRFLDFLEIVEYIVRKKKVKVIKDDNLKEGGFHKGDLDVDLTIDAVHNRDKYQTFILLSGDSDFEPLIKYLKNYGIKCIVISTKGHISIELIKQAKFINLKKLKKFIRKR